MNFPLARILVSSCESKEKKHETNPAKRIRGVGRWKNILMRNRRFPGGHKLIGAHRATERKEESHDGGGLRADVLGRDEGS